MKRPEPRRWSGDPCRAFWLSVLLLSGCRPRPPATPEALRQAYGRALRAPDSAAAYALLDPNLQATLPPRDFDTRWRANPKERDEAERALAALPAALTHPLLETTVVDRNGSHLRFARIDGHFRLVDGIFVPPPTQDPAAAIRSFLATLATLDLRPLEEVLTPDFLGRLRADWAEREAAIRRALSAPGALDLSNDGQRAVLRYDGHRKLLLRREPRGWRVAGFDDAEPSAQAPPHASQDVAPATRPPNGGGSP